jgi:hypothetical protein
MIPTIFNEETEFLSDDNFNSLKRHYTTFCWKIRKDFLVYIEYSMSHDSLIGSTISTRSEKCVLEQVRFLPQVFSHMIQKHQRYQRKINQMINTLRTLIMYFYPNLTLKDTGIMLRRKSKKIRIL